MAWRAAGACVVVNRRYGLKIWCESNSCYCLLLGSKETVIILGGKRPSDSNNYQISKY